jgi:uncharacterized membrane protein YdjX (TVP38/TMEM64 family)
MGRYRRLLAVVAFLAILLAVFELSGLRAHFNLEFLRQQLLDNPIGGLLIFVLLFVLGNLIQIPGWVFLGAAVLALGRSGGGLATYVAACFSCTVTFFVIRFVGGNALRQIDKKIAITLLRRLDAQPVRSVMLLRLLFQTIPALNYALALSGIKFRDYLVGTLLGLPVPIVLYCLFFDYVARVLKISAG